MPKKHSNKKNKDKKPQRPYVGDYGVAIESGPTKVGASFGMIVLSVLVGFLVGFIAWGAYRLALSLTDFVWNGVTPTIAQVLGTADVSSWWLPVVVCGFGGLVIGLWSRFVGGVPESLEVVMGSIKQTGEYRIKGFGRSIVGFFLPLMFGGSIGPEAGVTGIIASATCWIGRTLRKAGLRVKEIADVTVSAALSAIFITPLLGIVAVVQDALPKQDWELRDESSARDVPLQAIPIRFPTILDCGQKSCSTWLLPLVPLQALCLLVLFLVANQVFLVLAESIFRGVVSGYLYRACSWAMWEHLCIMLLISRLPIWGAPCKNLLSRVRF